MAKPTKADLRREELVNEVDNPSYVISLERAFARHLEEVSALVDWLCDDAIEEITIAELREK